MGGSARGGGGGSNVRLRTFESGLIAVQDRGVGDDRVAEAMRTLCREKATGKGGGGEGGISCMDVAKAVGCTPIMGSEYLKRGEELGFLCRDESIEGVNFFENKFPLF